jgi:endonuclease-3
MPPESLADKRLRARRIQRKLKKMYPAKTALHHDNPFQLLVATILSAQCTDERVNQVVPGLFKRFSSPQALAAAAQTDVEEIIRSTGFFRSKAKHIIAVSQALIEQYNAELPRTIEDLTKLDGVGRKTANVVLGSAFGIASGVVVDTHVGRLSRRMRLTRHDDPVKVEQDLMKLLPKTVWIEFSHQMIWHGRAICQARKPRCEECPLIADCPASRDFLPIKSLRRTNAKAAKSGRTGKT